MDLVKVKFQKKKIFLIINDFYFYFYFKKVEVLGVGGIKNVTTVLVDQLLTPRL
jgi:hypothetical protein